MRETSQISRVFVRPLPPGAKNLPVNSLISPKSYAVKVGQNRKIFGPSQKSIQYKYLTVSELAIF